MKTLRACLRLAMCKPALKPISAPRRIRLVAFDLDGTLTRGDTVCEIIGRHMGHLHRMRALEAICDKRRDRDSIRRLRTELASYYRVSTRMRLRSFLSSVTVAPGARKGFDLLRRSGITTAIVSIMWEFAAEWLAEKLGADYHVGTRLLDDGSIDHFWPEDKAVWLDRLMSKLDVRRHEAAAVGDSWRDVGMFDVVDHAIYVGRGRPPSPRVLHAPNGNIYEIARFLTGTDLRQGFEW
jgi:HAD superfamily phosphoserine phosphatase-like hydrolase